MDKYKERLFEIIRKDNQGIPLTKEDYMHVVSILVRENPYEGDLGGSKPHIIVAKDPGVNMSFYKKLNLYSISEEYLDDVVSGKSSLENYILTTMHERKHQKQKIEMDSIKDGEPITKYQRDLLLDEKTSVQNDKFIEGKLSTFHSTFKDYFATVWDIATEDQKQEMLETVEFCLYFQEFAEIDASKGAIEDMRALMDSIVNDNEAPDDVKKWAQDKYKFIDQKETDFKIDEQNSKIYIDDFFGMEIEEIVESVGSKIERAEGKPTYEGVCRRSSGALKIMLSKKDLYFNLMCYQYSLKNPRKIEKDGEVIYKKNDILNDALRSDIADKMEHVPQEKKAQLSKVMAKFGIKNEGVELSDIEMFLTEEDKVKYLSAKPVKAQVEEDIEEM